MGSSEMPRCPIHDPITVIKIDINKTLHRMLIVICERKLSFLSTMLADNLSADACTNKTK